MVYYLAFRYVLAHYAHILVIISVDILLLQHMDAYSKIDFVGRLFFDFYPLKHYIKFSINCAVR